MFSGIISDVGRIENVQLYKPNQADVRLTLSSGSMDMSDLSIGDSISVQGACLTIVQLEYLGTSWSFQVDISAETAAKTVGLCGVGLVNLEKSVRLQDRINGHCVLGHVDGVGLVSKFESRGQSYWLEVITDAALARYWAPKGSVAINGVSLTVNTVEDIPSHTVKFSVNIIPHTFSCTTLRDLSPGVQVNLEADLMARYCSRCFELMSLGVSSCTSS